MELPDEIIRLPVEDLRACLCRTSSPSRAFREPKLCLNPTAQKDNREVLGASFPVEQFSETVGYSNMADYTNHIICELLVVKLC